MFVRCFTVILLIVGSAPLWAQTDFPRVTREDMALEGKRELRDEFHRSRRQARPGRSDFNASEARLRAVFEMQAQERMNRGTGFNWTAIGPGPTTNGQTPTFDPRFPSDVSGRVTAIAIDPIDDAVYVGGAQGGVWKSTDNGASWTPLTDDLASLAIGSIAIDPAPHAPGQATIYIGTGEGNGSCDSYGGVGVYKSTDSGATWTGPIATNQFIDRGITAMVVDRTNSNNVLLTSASGISGTSCTAGPVFPARGVYRSTDAGATWTQVSTGNNRGSRIIQDPVDDNVFWAAMWFTGNGGDDGGLLRSTDSGATWTQIAGTGGLPNPNVTGRSWVTAAGDGGSPAQTVLYYATSENGGTVYRSADGGTTWTALPNTVGYCNPQCGYDMPIYVDPSNPDRFYTGGAGASQVGVLPSSFMRSDDAGANMIDLVRSADMSTAMHADLHAFATWPGESNRLWVGNDGGLWRSDDFGDNLINVNNNIQLTQFSGGDIDPTDPNRAYGGTQDNGTMGWTGSVAWPHLDFGDGGFALIDQATPNNLVHTYFNQTNNLIGCGWTNNGFTTTMGFYNFSSAPGNGISITDRVLFYAPMHLDRNTSDTLYFGTNRLNRATTFFVAGGPFTQLAGGQDLAPGGGALAAIETVVGNPNLIFTGSSSGEIFRSTDGGASFTQVNTPGVYVSDVRVDHNDNNIVYASLSGFNGDGQNILKSSDGGTSWNTSATGVPDIPVNALEMDPLVANRVWAGTDIGMYVSSDAGATWTPANDGFPVVAVFDLKANAATSGLVAFTHGRSAFRLDLSTCAAASIDTQPVSQTSCPGTSVTLTVTVSGDTPSYQWQKDGQDLVGETSATLTIASVTAKDAGSYTCVVTNACSNVTSSPAVLTVDDVSYNVSQLPGWSAAESDPCLDRNGNTYLDVADLAALVDLLPLP